MTINTGALLKALQSDLPLFLSLAKTVVTNPSLVTGALAAEKSGQWLPFVEAELPTLLPMAAQILTAMEGNQALATGVLDAVVNVAAAVVVPGVAGS